MTEYETDWERPDFDSVPSLAENTVWRLPGVDAVAVRKTLQDVYRDFCKRSAALRTWRRIALVDGTSRYPVCPVMSGQIDCIARVLHNGRDWSAVRIGRGLEPEIFTGEGDWHFHENDFIEVETVEVPNISEERAPRAFLKRYGDALVAGALARLMSMAGKAWSDAEQARQNGVEYENAIAEARYRGYCGSAYANGSASSISMGGFVA